MSTAPSPSYPPPGGQSAQEQVKLPSIFLMVVGGLDLLLSLLSLFLNLLGAGMGVAAGGQEATNAIFSGVLGILGAIFGLVLGVLILFGSYKMYRLESYAFAMTGVIAAMLPCSGCCFIGIPLGIWSLIILLRPEVKEAFR